jgi:hypothetical protein
MAASVQSGNLQSHAIDPSLSVRATLHFVGREALPISDF